MFINGLFILFACVFDNHNNIYICLNQYFVLFITIKEFIKWDVRHFNLPKLKFKINVFLLKNHNLQRQTNVIF